MSDEQTPRSTAATIVGQVCLTIIILAVLALCGIALWARNG